MTRSRSAGSLRAWNLGVARLVLAACIGLASTASATPSVDLFFTELNGSSIDPTRSLVVTPGDTVGVEMRMTSDERGVSLYSISVDFDSAGLERLRPDAYATVVFPGFLRLGTGLPWGPSDPLGVPGFIKHFAAALDLSSCSQ